MNYRTNAMSCPRCQKLISNDELKCPYCGISHPGRFQQSKRLLHGFGSPAKWIRSIIVLNVGMYLISLLLSKRISGFPASPLAALSPDNQSILLLGATGTLPINQLHRWWSLVSANFLHMNLLHIFFNLTAFGQIAPLLLRQYGVYRTTTIYILGGGFGFVLSYWAGVTLTIGASAAVCSLVGALLYYAHNRGGFFGQILFRQVGGWVVMLFVFGFLVPGINNWGHGGGILAGAGLALLLGYEEKRPENKFHRIIGTGCALATLVILVMVVASGLINRFSGTN